MKEKDEKLINSYLWNLEIRKLMDLHGTERCDMIEDLMVRLTEETGDDDIEYAESVLEDAKKWQAMIDDKIATRVLEDAILNDSPEDAINDPSGSR